MYKNKRGVILECKLPWLVYRDCYQLTAQSWYIMSIWESFSWRRLNQKPSVLRVKVKSLSHVWLFATPWTVASQASPSMGFSRQVYWSGLPFPSPGDLPNPGMEPRFLALQVDSLLFKPPWKIKEDVQMINNHMTRCSIWLAIREMQIKTMMRCDFTPIRMAIIKKTDNNRCWWRNWNPEYWWECKMPWPFQKRSLTVP